MLNKSMKMLKNKYVSINCYFFIFIIELAQYAKKVPHKEPDMRYRIFNHNCKINIFISIFRQKYKERMKNAYYFRLKSLSLQTIT